MMRFLFRILKILKKLKILNQYRYVQWLPKLRREIATVRELLNCRRHARSLLYGKMSDIPVQRLFSRRAVWRLDPHLSTMAWSTSIPINVNLILDFNNRSAGFELHPKYWVLLNRFRTSHRADVHFSCIHGGLENHLLETLVPSNKSGGPLILSSLDLNL
jgi:hypothetical protein